jgi:hypothetical protein
MSGPEVLDERVVTGIFGDDVKNAGRIGSNGSADVVSKREIEGIPASRSKAHQLHRDSMFEKLFDQGNIKLHLSRAYQKYEGGGLASDDREVDLTDVLEIYEDVVYGRREIGGDGMHPVCD